MPTEREELMMDGLHETSQYLHGLLRESINEVGAGNVVLGGLSQGCAATLISLLTWESEPLAAVFGLCGWLPLRQHMTDIVDPRIASDGEDPFACDDDADQELDLPAQAVAWLREELALPITPSLSGLEAASMTSPSSSSVPSSLLPFQRIPLFLAHGTEDEKVNVQLGHEAKACLAILRAELDWREYERLGHWYSGQMLGDLVEFLTEKTCMKNLSDRSQAGTGE